MGGVAAEYSVRNSKPKWPLAALREDKTLSELSQQFELHPTQIVEWKKQLLERASDIFASGQPAESVNLAPLHAKMGQPALEIDFLSGALTQAGWLSARQCSTVAIH